jgi:hypothetical protein
MNTESKARGKSWSFVLILVILACGLTAAFGLLYVMNVHDTPASQIAAIHARNPSFNLENTTPQVDAVTFEATQEALLQGYGWVDRNENVARIPIERAMEILSQNTPEQTPAVPP